MRSRFTTLTLPVRRAARSLANKFGYDFYRIKFDTPSGRPLYEPLRPTATYSPWNDDPEFLETYDVISRSTLVDKYRCYDLWSLVGQSSKLEGSLIEIGVWRGGTGTLIARKSLLCGIDAPVYLCDTFRGVVKASAQDSVYNGGEHADTSRERVESLLAKMSCDNAVILEGIFPDDTGEQVESGTFRFCHIDVDVYESARDIVEWIWDKMVVGGIVVFDDYGTEGCDGVTKFVNEQSSMPGRFMTYNLNGHAVLIKTG